MGLEAVIIGPSYYRGNDSIRVEYAIPPTDVAPIIELFIESTPISGLKITAVVVVTLFVVDTC